MPPPNVGSWESHDAFLRAMPGHNRVVGVCTEGLHELARKVTFLEECMEINDEKLQQTVLALLQLNLSDDSGRRAWKSLPWGVMDALHEKGYISDPATKNKSIVLTEEGRKLSEELFEQLFATK